MSILQYFKYLDQDPTHSRIFKNVDLNKKIFIKIYIITIFIDNLSKVILKVTKVNNFGYF